MPDWMTLRRMRQVVDDCEHRSLVGHSDTPCCFWCGAPHDYAQDAEHRADCPIRTLRGALRAKGTGGLASPGSQD